MRVEREALRIKRGTRPTDCHEQRHKLTQAGVDPERHTHTHISTHQHTHTNTHLHEFVFKYCTEARTHAPYACTNPRACIFHSFGFFDLHVGRRGVFIREALKKSLSSLRAVRHATGLMIPHKPPLANK